jgi:hypothetical protein
MSLSDLPVGTFMASTQTQTICMVCKHRHERKGTSSSGGIRQNVYYIAGCPICLCTVSKSDYYGEKSSWDRRFTA